MKVLAYTTTNLKDIETLSTYSTRLFQSIVTAVNGNLTFLENMKCRIVVVDFTAADTEVQVLHGLGIIPAGYISVWQNAAASVYATTTTWTDRSIYLKASAICQVKLLIF